MIQQTPTTREAWLAERRTLPTTAIATDYGSLDPWLAGRKFGIGASDSAGLFNEGYANQSPVSIAIDKLGLAETPREETEALEIGSAMQPGILALAQKRLGMRIDNPGEFTIYRHPDFPWLCASLDGAIVEDLGEPTVAEAKYIGNLRAASEWGEDSEPVLKFDVQCQHQMAVMGWRQAFLFGLVGSKLVCKFILRNDRFIDTALIPHLQKFWNLIEEGKAAIAAGETPLLPEIDGSEATRKALAALYCEDNGEQIALPGAEYVQAFKDWRGANEKIKELKELEQAAKNLLVAGMGNAAEAILDDGTRISNFQQSTVQRPRTLEECKTTSFRVLRHVKGKRR